MVLRSPLKTFVSLNVYVCDRHLYDRAKHCVPVGILSPMGGGPARPAFATATSALHASCASVPSAISRATSSLVKPYVLIVLGRTPRKPDSFRMGNTQQNPHRGTLCFRVLPRVATLLTLPCTTPRSPGRGRVTGGSRQRTGQRSFFTRVISFRRATGVPKKLSASHTALAKQQIVARPQRRLGRGASSA